MKKALITGICILYSFNFYTQKAICFTENKGQVVDQNYQARPDVLFGGQCGGLFFHLRVNGISYQLNRVDKWKDAPDLFSLKSGEQRKNRNKIIDEQTIYRIDVNWVNADINALIQKSSALTGYNNFYTEGCPKGGALTVKSYQTVIYQNIYKGIDLKWYESKGELKYDYLCKAGADYKKIQLQIKGAKQLSLNSKGELIIKTQLGTIIEKAPLVIQNNTELKSKWILQNNSVGFEIENLNPSLSYVIDPAVRVWGTYYGGNGTDQGNSSACDMNGNVYLSGATDANTGTIIATVGAHQTTIGGGTDAFLVKLDPSGVRQWGTYYGGSGNDVAYSCATDNGGNLYMTGNTGLSTGTVIATPGSHQTNFGGSTDAFLVKFNTAGVRQWGTYYGGIDVEQGYSCSTDANGDVYMAGIAGTNTGTVIATSGSHQSAFGGGVEDAFVVKFSAGGVRQWGTYYGGTNNDKGLSCKSDGFGNVYLTGMTESNNGTVIATFGAHQPTLGGFLNAYLVKFNGAGVRQWGTYYGGSDYDEGHSCTTDAAGNVYMAGRATSSVGTAIATAGAHQPSLGGIWDAYLVKFNASGVRQWGTYYGGTGFEQGNSCVTNANGDIILTGTTDFNTSTVIATAGAHQSTLGGSEDGYLVKFNTNGIRQWGTYYGGIGNDISRSCIIDALSNVFIAGTSSSNTGTAVSTLGAHQSTHGGGTFDAFLVKFSDCSAPSSPVGGNQSSCANNSATLTATGSGTINWFASPTSTTILGTGTNYVTPTLSAGTYTFYAEALTCTVSASRTPITVTVNPNPTVTVNTSTTQLCVGSSATLTANGASNYTWNPGGNGASIVVSPTANTTYTITGTDANGCQNTTMLTLSVTNCGGVGLTNYGLNENAIVIYPNPAKDHVKITGLKNSTSILIFNSLGSLLYQEVTTGDTATINILQFSKGIYLIRAGDSFKKLIIE